MSILVGVIMGSKSDWESMKYACEVLDQFEIAYEKKVVSAHRTPDLMFTYSKEARERGLKVIIAGAGGAAHLPGMVAAQDHPASNRCSRTNTGIKGVGLFTVHRPNAGWCTSSNRCDWKSGCSECRFTGRTNFSNG